MGEETPAFSVERVFVWACRVWSAWGLGRVGCRSPFLFNLTPPNSSKFAQRLFSAPGHSTTKGFLGGPVGLGLGQGVCCTVGLLDERRLQHLDLLVHYLALLDQDPPPRDTRREVF